MTMTRDGIMNNYSMFTADRMTHFKIVVVALVCATLVVGIGIAARVTDGTAANGRLEATVIKAGTPVQATATDGNTVR
jgi:ABC-type proline/glycine betaine transport system permease subunit